MIKLIITESQLKTLKENIQSEEILDEMAYPTQFNPEEFENIKSFAGKIKYVKERLLGKIGSGSARAVFQIDNEKVLKVALNKKGIAQNEAESEYYKQEYPIVARVFDTDNDSMWLEMELAKKITPSRFQQLTGVSLDTVHKYLRTFKKYEYKYGLDREAYDNLSENEFLIDLLEFAGNNSYQIPGDFSRISTYGEVLRNGEPTVVIIDFGATEDVIDTYYTRKR